MGQTIFFNNADKTTSLRFRTKLKAFISKQCQKEGVRIEALQYVIDQIHPQKVVTFPQEVHIEGGDVMPYGNYIFVGTYYGDDYSSYITARTNMAAVTALQELFPKKIVKPFNLVCLCFFYRILLTD